MISDNNNTRILISIPVEYRERLEDVAKMLQDDDVLPIALSELIRKAIRVLIKRHENGEDILSISSTSSAKLEKLLVTIPINIKNNIDGMVSDLQPKSIRPITQAKLVRVAIKEYLEEMESKLSEKIKHEDSATKEIEFSA